MSEQEIMNLNQGYPLLSHPAAVRELAGTGDERCGQGEPHGAGRRAVRSQNRAGAADMQTAVPLQAFSGSGVLQGLGVGSTAHGARGRQLMEAHHLEQGSASFSCQGSGSKYLGHMDP